MNILVLGASGHVGAYLVDELVRAGHNVDADVSMDHIGHSPCCTGEKVKRVLGVEMQYSIMDIYKEYLEYQATK